jgi:hypothetical protein
MMHHVPQAGLTVPAVAGPVERVVRPHCVRARVLQRDLLPEDLDQGLALGQFIDELVQLPNSLHQRVLNFFDSYAANYALDEAGVWMDGRSCGKEGLEVCLQLDLAPQTSFVVASEPADDLVDLLLGSALSLCLLHVHRVHSCEGSREDSVLGHFRRLVCGEKAAQTLIVRPNVRVNRPAEASAVSPS